METRGSLSRALLIRHALAVGEVSYWCALLRQGIERLCYFRLLSRHLLEDGWHHTLTLLKDTAFSLLTPLRTLIHWW